MSGAVQPFPNNYRYWRLYWVDDLVPDSGGTFALWNEIEWYTIANKGGTKYSITPTFFDIGTGNFGNPYSGQLASLSNGVTTENDYDGAAFAMWRNSIAGSWLKFDMGTARTLKSVAVYIHSAYFGTRHMHIDGSDDGTTWIRGVSNAQFPNNVDGGIEVHPVVINIP